MIQLDDTQTDYRLNNLKPLHLKLIYFYSLMSTIDSIRVQWSVDLKWLNSSSYLIVFLFRFKNQSKSNFLKGTLMQI